MKKVLHVLPMNKLSGAEKVALSICENLTQFKPVIVCGGEILKKIFKKEGIEAYSIDFSKKNKLLIIKALKKIIIESDIDVIHAHDNIASIYSYIAKRDLSKNVKVISHIHSCYPWLKANGLNKKIDTFFRNKYDKNIICGKLVYDFYRKNSTYLQEKKIKVLSNAVDVKQVKKLKIDNSIYKEFKIPRNKKIIGFVGRLEEVKGIIPFIKEVINKKEQFEDCVILLIGSGSQEEKIEKLIKENKLEEKILLIGFQKDVNKFYPIMDIFFLPSLYEGLPIVILEAMAHEKTVVAMNVGSIFEVIENNKTGILINNDIQEFVNKINEIKNNEEQINRLGKCARKKILEEYSMEKYIGEIEYEYNALIKQI